MNSSNPLSRNRPTPTSIALLVACAAILLVPAAVEAQAGPEKISVPLTRPGEPVWLEIELVYGSIDVEAHDGPEVVVEVRPRGGSEPKEDAEATQGGLRRIPNASFEFSVEEKDNKVSVQSDSWKRALDVTARVPRNTTVRLSTVNQGHVRIVGVAGEHEISNTNGAITAERIAGSLVAQTVNGAVTVTFTSVSPDRPMSFASLNGDVDITLPADFRADAVLDAGNGDVYTDFDLALTTPQPKVEKGRDGGRFRVEVSREMRGKINGGGPEVHFETFNGDIFLRRNG